MRRIRVMLVWQDMWIGVFIDTKKQYIYLALLPMIVLRFDYASEDTRTLLSTTPETIEALCGILAATRTLGRVGHDARCEWKGCNSIGSMHARGDEGGYRVLCPTHVKWLRSAEERYARGDITMNQYLQLVADAEGGGHHASTR